MKPLPRVEGRSSGDKENQAKLKATGGTVAAISEEEAAFEEPAAILEYDGDLSREEAEAEAALDYPELPTFLDRRGS